MDLKEFSKYYKLVSQEPVDIIYDIELDENKDLEVESIYDVIEKHIERYDRVVRNEEINYFIYDLNGHEVFNTVVESELIMKMKELVEELGDEERL